MMKKTVWLAILLLLQITGCANMTPREKQTAYIVGGLIGAAIIISIGSDNNRSPNCRLVPVPDGHIQVCQ